MPPRQTKEQLRARWLSLLNDYVIPPKRWSRPTIQKQIDFVRLVGDEPFGRVEGRVDLRCLDLTSFIVRTVPGTLHSVDLSDASFDNADFEEPTWTDFVFTRTRFTNCAIRAGQLTDCAFDRTQLGGTFLGSRSWSGGIRSTYQRCEFFKARTASLFLGASDFRDCLFESVTGRIEPGTATFEDCRFVGPLHDFEFRTGWPAVYRRRERRGPEPVNTMRNVDLSEAVLSFVTVDGLDLSTVKLDPARQFVIADWPSVRARIHDVPPVVAEEKAGAFWYFAAVGPPAIADLTWIDSQFAPGSAEVLRRALDRG